MTTPPPPQQQAQQQAVAEIATAITVATTAAAAAGMLTSVIGLLNVRPPVLQMALAIVYSFPPDRLGVSGVATVATSRLNLVRRAQFVLSAAGRLQQDALQAQAHGASVKAALEGGVARERRYYGQHLVAIWNRMNAAARVDTAVSAYGLLLGWNTVLDDRTSPECRAADRHNFRADAVPLIGYPGAVHTHCRCWPGHPFPGARMLPSAVPVRVPVAA